MPPVPQAALDAQQELAAKKNRVRYSAEVMEATTRTALTYGAGEAGLRHKVPEDTVRTWLAFYRKNDKKIPTPQKRGRAPLEPPEREKEIAGIADSLRSRGEKLDARHWHLFFSKQKTLLQRDQYYNGFNYNGFSKKVLINPVVNEACTVVCGICSRKRRAAWDHRRMSGMIWSSGGFVTVSNACSVASSSTGSCGTASSAKR